MTGRTAVVVAPVPATRAFWGRRAAFVIALACAWACWIGLALVTSASTSSTSSTSTVLLGSKGAVLRQRQQEQQANGFVICQQQQQQQLRRAAAPPAACAGDVLPAAADIQHTFGNVWGEASCMPLQQACMDQGTFVVFGARHNMLKGGESPVNKFKLGTNHLDFSGFGDVIGIIQHPEVIVRPGGAHEETQDLRAPVFSNCSRPVVLYINHLYMWGDWMVRTMPTFVNALHVKAWDTRFSIIVSTGGQELAPWQKLMLQPLTQHPIVTLSQASSRATTTAQPAGSSRGRLATARRLSVSSSQQQPGQQQQQQQQQLQHAPASGAPITAFGRCFESVVLCSLQNPRAFPPVGVSRPVWRGAQLVKQYWLAAYGAAYSRLLPQQDALKARRAFRVVFAIRDAAELRRGVPLNDTVRLMTNLPDVLEWCNSWVPLDVNATAVANYSRTVCVAHQFGQHGRVLTRPAQKAGGGARPLPADPDLDPRALLNDIAVADHADVVVGVHGAQLYNALFMSAGKALVELRPRNFIGGWPGMYFREPLVMTDAATGIHWYGIDTANASNSRPGRWEAAGMGCCHERDRHVRMETRALEHVFRRILWVGADARRYRQLLARKEVLVTDTLQPGDAYEVAVQDNAG